MKYIPSIIAYALLALLTLAFVALLCAPRLDDIPPSLNPFAPFNLNEERGIWSDFKLRRALSNGEACRAALSKGDVRFEAFPDRISAENPNCHTKERVVVTQFGDVSTAPLDTRCDMALRVAVWLKWDAEPLSEKTMGKALSGIDHFGSYSCRAQRGTNGASTRMSKHATSNAVDIAGFRFSDGSKVTLKSGWNGEGSQFLHAVRDAACKRFRLVLSPDYNALHADHFHLQETGGWGCR